MITTLNKLGLLHSYNDMPSLIDGLGNKFWHIDGKLERPGDLPCLEFINGEKRYSLDNGCYKITTEDNEIYYNSNNEFHRLDGPAIIEYYENGNIKYEHYCIDGQKHRLDGPAFIWYYENGNIESEYYYVNGKQSRLDGPAEIWYYENGNIKYKEYYINDNQITKEQFLKLSTTLQSNIIP